MTAGIKLKHYRQHEKASFQKNKIQNESKTARWVQTCLKDDAKVQACWKNVAIKPN